MLFNVNVLNKNAHIIPSYVCSILGLIVLAIPRLHSRVVTLFMFNIIKYFIPLTKSNQAATTGGGANIARRDGLWWTDSNDNTFARHVKEAFFKGDPRNIFKPFFHDMNYSGFYHQFFAFSFYFKQLGIKPNCHSIISLMLNRFLKCL